MERRITTTLPTMLEASYERPTQRMERMAQEEVTRELGQDSLAKQREEVSRQELGLSLVEAHEVNDRFVRLLEDDAETTNGNAALPERRQTAQLYAPAAQPLREQAKRPTLNDFFSNMPRNLPPHAVKHAFREFAALERHADDQRNLAHPTFRARPTKRLETKVHTDATPVNKADNKH